MYFGQIIANGGEGLGATAPALGMVAGADGFLLGWHLFRMPVRIEALHKYASLFGRAREVALLCDLQPPVRDRDL